MIRTKDKARRIGEGTCVACSGGWTRGYRRFEIRLKMVASLGLIWLTFCLLMLQLGCAREKHADLSELVWVNSFDEAIDVAGKKNKMIMVDFYADWCGWCRKLDETTYKDKDVIARGSNFINVRVDADRAQELVKKYRISGLPTIIFMDSAGKEIHRVVGYRPPQDFIKEMDLAESNLNKRQERGVEH